METRRAKKGRRREARTTNDEALRPRSRKADPNRPGPRSGPQTHAVSGRARSARPQTNKRDLRAACRRPTIRAALAATAAASVNQPRKSTDNTTVEAGVSENVTSV